jgi:methionine aminotransferase
MQPGIIDLAAGYSTLPAPTKLVKLLKQTLNQSYFPYAPAEGILPLRQSISELVKHLYSHAYNPETEITVTAGATQAIYTAISAFVGEEDEVILFEPAYDCYAPAIHSCHGHPVYIRYKLPDFRIDWDEVLKGITNRTRMIIINSPHNPTGSILTAFDMEKLQKVTNGTKIVVVSDEVFEHTIFEGIEHQSVARYPQLAERSLAISSFGKSFHIPGWKIGYCIAPESIMHGFREAHQFQMQSVHTPSQYALADYIIDPLLFHDIHILLEKKRNDFLKKLQGTKWKWKAALGTYFQLLDFSGITDQPDTEFAQAIAEKSGLITLPLSLYYHDQVASGYLKLCFAREDHILSRAGEILYKLG